MEGAWYWQPQAYAQQSIKEDSLHYALREDFEASRKLYFARIPTL
jgi:hypothetical protein